MSDSPRNPVDSREMLSRMDALTRANVRLLQRVASLEERLAALEHTQRGAVQTPPEPAAETVPSPPPDAPVPPEAVLPLEQAPEQTSGPSEPASPVAVPDETPIAPHVLDNAPPRRESAETNFGLNWLNRIGAVTLILGAAFFFKYAVDNDWIGPTARVLIGIVAGLGLLTGGEQLRKRGHARFAQGISGAGVCVLYLSFWAAAMLYGLVPAWFAFAALVADTALAGALAVRHRATVLALLGLLGGYLTPIALSTGEYHPWIFFGYLFLVNAGWLTIARRQGWLVLDVIALPVTCLLAAQMSVSIRDADQGPVGTFMALTQYAAFALTPIRVYLMIAQFLAGVALGVAWMREPITFAVPALALAAAGLALAHYRRIASLPLFALAGFAAGFGIMPRFSAGESELVYLTVAACGFLLIHAWLPFRILSGFEITRSDLALQPANAVFLFAAGMALLRGEYHDWLGFFAAAMGVLYLATGFFLWPRLPDQARDKKTIVLIAGIAIAMFTAAIPLQFESIRITVLWAMEAVALAWIARRFEGWEGRAACLVVGALALVRLLTIDIAFDLVATSADATAFFNSQFVTVLITALALGAAAWILKPEKWALPPYLGAHLALLTGLIAEIVYYASRNHGDDWHSFALVGTSLMMAAYGLALVAIGVGTRTSLNRMLGLGLLALVVLKLYSFDVWTMRRIYRIVAFAGLGGLLLATSFLYSRFRPKIEALLRDETN